MSRSRRTRSKRGSKRERKKGRKEGRKKGRKERFWTGAEAEGAEGDREGAGGRSTGMVDHPWMSGGVHGVTHAPRLAIGQEQAAL